MRDYEALLICFRSGQLDAAEMQAHMADDAGLAAYVNSHLQATSLFAAAPNKKSLPERAGK